MELTQLDNLFTNLGVDPTDDQLAEMYDLYCVDFVDEIFVFKGSAVKVIAHNSKVSGYETYPETFVHLVTRKSNGGKRVFDKHRANKIHWIRYILENCDDEEITYFEYPESDGKLREYYWYEAGDFLVIMEQITPDYKIITSFHIDSDRNRKYFKERELWYRNQE